jgi:hypothetical protein
MGLRIIDRQRPIIPTPPSDSDIQAALAQACASWTTLSTEEIDEFITHFRDVRAQLGPAELIAQTAGDIKKRMSSRSSDFTKAHGDIDLATLLDLLDNN